MANTNHRGFTMRNRPRVIRAVCFTINCRWLPDCVRSYADTLHEHWYEG